MRWNWLPEYKGLREETRFVLGETNLNLSWYFSGEGMPRLEIGVGRAKVTPSLPLPGRAWRLMGQVESDGQADRLCFNLIDAAGRQMIVISSLVAGASAVRITFQLPPRSAGEVSELSLKGESSELLATANSLPGTIVVGTHLFIAAEHPASAASVMKHHFDFRVPLSADVPEVTVAVGPLIEGAPYRAFRRYVAANRARPGQPFLHYNSWYDIGYDGKSYDEAESRQVIRAITKKLVVERHVPLDGFVFDDGWDDKTTLWQFHGGFPHGFQPLSADLSQSAAVLGTWLSPWGGYNEAKTMRLAAAQKRHFSTGENGLLLSDPRYFAFFREVARDMIARQNIKYLKLDGIGSPAGLQGNDIGLREGNSWPSSDCCASCARTRRTCSSMPQLAPFPRPSGCGTPIPSGGEVMTATSAGMARRASAGQPTAMGRSTATP